MWVILLGVDLVWFTLSSNFATVLLNALNIFVNSRAASLRLSERMIQFLITDMLWYFLSLQLDVSHFGGECVDVLFENLKHLKHLIHKQVINERVSLQKLYLIYQMTKLYVQRVVVALKFGVLQI